MEKRMSLSWLRRWSLALLVLTLITAVAPAVHAQNTVGTITQLTGTANIQRSGATIAAALNMPVMLHDKVATDANGSLTIGMVDNSSLQLGASSTIVIDDSVLVNGVGAPSKVGLLNGNLHSIILGAMRGSSTTFEVNTPNSIGAVRGTDFETHTDNNARKGYPDCFQWTDLQVESGTVEFCNTASPPECKDITAGHHSTIGCGGFIVLNPGIGAIGATALGAALAGGVGVGVAAGSGAFGGGGSNSPSK
jgi:hypothetical protein